MDTNAHNIMDILVYRASATLNLEIEGAGPGGLEHKETMRLSVAKAP